MVRKKITPIKEELQRTKEDLADLEMYIEDFSSFLPLAVCTLNPLEIIIDINQAFQDLTSYSLTEIIGESLERIFLEKKEAKSLLNKTREKRMVRTEELTLISKEEKKIPVRVFVSVRIDEKGNFIGYFLTLADITEVKKFQEKTEEKVKRRTKELEGSRMALMNMLEDVEESRKALTNVLEDVDEARKRAEEERDKTKAIITNFADGLVVLEKGNRISLINAEGERLLNVKTKEIENKTLSDLSNPPAIKKIAELIRKTKDEGLFRKELSFKKPAERVLEITSISLASREEAVIILHDITREKLIEKMKTEFVSLAAHQLRTPLSAIKWTLKMLLEGDLGKITDEQQDFIQKTYNSNERMISLINDLLDVTRIEEGRYLYKPALTQLENIVQFVVNSLKEEIKRKRIKFEFKKPKEKLPKVKVDVEKIRLVINNLLDNAIRYTPTGGKVTISLKHGKEKVEFSIKDTGVGVPEDQKNRVFAKFFRGANVMRMATEGTGLGLFIAKNIIEAHGGKIWFESTEEKGTTFYFTLPVKKEFAEFLKEF